METATPLRKLRIIQGKEKVTGTREVAVTMEKKPAKHIMKEH